MPNTKIYEPHGFTLFCDDIREEASGKTTYVGVYNDVLKVVGSLPTTLPSFGMAIHLFCNTGETPESLTIQVALPGNDIDKPEMTMPVDVEKLTPQHRDMPATDDEIFAPRSHLGFKILVHNFPVSKPGRLRLTALWNGNRISLGSLAILHEQSPVNETDMNALFSA